MQKKVIIKSIGCRIEQSCGGINHNRDYKRNSHACVLVLRRTLSSVVSTEFLFECRYRTAATASEDILNMGVASQNNIMYVCFIVVVWKDVNGLWLYPVRWRFDEQKRQGVFFMYFFLNAPFCIFMGREFIMCTNVDVTMMIACRVVVSRSTLCWCRVCQELRFKTHFFDLMYVSPGWERYTYT